MRNRSPWRRSDNRWTRTSDPWDRGGDIVLVDWGNESADSSYHPIFPTAQLWRMSELESCLRIAVIMGGDNAWANWQDREGRLTHVGASMGPESCCPERVLVSARNPGFRDEAASFERPRFAQEVDGEITNFLWEGCACQHHRPGRDGDCCGMLWSKWDDGMDTVRGGD